VSPIIWMASYLQLCNYKIAVFHVITTNVIIMIRYSRFCNMKSAVFYFRLEYNNWSEHTFFWVYILRWKSALLISCVKEQNARNFFYIIWSENNLLLKLLAFVCLLNFEYFSLHNLQGFLSKGSSSNDVKKKERVLNNNENCKKLCKSV